MRICVCTYAHLFCVGVHTHRYYIALGCHYLFLIAYVCLGVRFTHWTTVWLHNRYGTSHVIYVAWTCILLPHPVRDSSPCMIYKDMCEYPIWGSWVVPYLPNCQSGKWYFWNLVWSQKFRGIYSDPSRRRSMTGAILSSNHKKIWSFCEEMVEKG